jgi:hypothetical protein
MLTDIDRCWKMLTDVNTFDNTKVDFIIIIYQDNLYCSSINKIWYIMNGMYRYYWK